MSEARGDPGGEHRGQPVLQHDQHPLLRLLKGGGVHGKNLVGTVQGRREENYCSLEKATTLLKQECHSLENERTLILSSVPESLAFMLTFI